MELNNVSEKTFGKQIWGPIAWHLLHTFSIGNGKKIKEEDKKSYYIFYKTFGYIIPCFICSEHYKNLCNIFMPLEKEKMNREYIIKWVYDVHNRVNKNLGKDKYNLEDCIRKNIEYRDAEIFFFIDNIYLNYDYKNISIYHFHQLMTFYIYFCKLYPNKKIRKMLLKRINTDRFREISTPSEFYDWYKLIK
jgi:hypothetical protein